MKDRIKLLRHTLNLTQQKFADRLGIKANAISQYESGRNAPIDAVISLICREFNVDEIWLRTGDGEMFRQDEKTAIDRLCSELHASALETEIIRAYFKIDENVRESFMQQLIQAVQHSPTGADTTRQDRTVADAGGQEWTELNMEARMAELERQNQVLTARLAAVEEEDAGRGIMDESSTSHSESAGKFSAAEKVKI